MTKEELAEKLYPIRDGDFGHMTDETIEESMEGKRKAFLAGFNAASEWVRIEPNCEMPDFDEPVLWIDEAANMHVEALDKDGNPWIFEKIETEFGYMGNKCTHWKRIVPPTD